MLQAPFPYFGGKSRIAGEIWRRLGDCPNYVEPFLGSAAMLLARPDDHDWGNRAETVNDLSGYIANFWRAVSIDPDAVAHYADWPVNENDLHARHYWLVQQKERLGPALEGDPAWYDAQVAGWWVWGMACWIGGGFCSGEGPWHAVDGKLVEGDPGRGVNRQLPHLGTPGQGVNRKLPHLGTPGRGLCGEWSEHLTDYMRRLSDRLRRVRVCCGDWSRVCGPSVTEKLGLTAMFFDPPYGDADRDMDVYGDTDSPSVAGDVLAWCQEHGNNPLYRIAICGYQGEHDALEAAGWDVLYWKAPGGFAGQRKTGTNTNGTREVVWFSPHCLEARQKRLL